MQDKIALGPHLRELRLAADLSVEQLAARAGVSAGTISRIERGVTHNPGFTILGKIAAALGFASVDAMLTGDSNAGQPRLQTPGVSANHVSPSNVEGFADDLRPPGTRLMPVYRWGSCGDPRDRESAPDPDDQDYPPLGKERLIGPRGFAVRVSGESMANRQMHGGDVVWINPDAPVRSGRPVLARVWAVDGSELGMVVKVWKHQDGMEGLWADGDGDDGHSPMVCSRYDLIGPVVWITRGFPPP